MKHKIINPSNSKVLAKLESGGLKEAEAAVAKARRAFDSGEWPRYSLAERRKFLLKIAGGILSRAGELASLESANTGKPIKETTFMDIPSSAKTFEFVAENLEKFLAVENVPLPHEAAAHLQRLPQGVAVLIVPWNYPLLIASWKMAQALGAGNTVILKPASLTPLTALELGKIAQEAGLPDGAVNVLVASGEETGKFLCSDPRVDMVSFTGSSSVGQKIVGYSSFSPKKLLMELGGKSAGIILKDADLETAANGALCSAFLNQGQMCTAMSRLLVADEIYEKFSREFCQKAGRIRLGPADDHETQTGPLASAEQRKKVAGLVGKAVQQGARLLCGGKVPDSAALKDGFFFEPTVFGEVNPGMAIFKEEVFGPVVTLTSFSNPEEAAALANNSDYGLAGCIWSKDKAAAEKMAAKIHAGTIWINTYGMFYNELPYGGFKQSGFGKELGREGFLEYTKLQSVITDQSRDKPLVSYWYGF